VDGIISQKYIFVKGFCKKDYFFSVAKELGAIITYKLKRK
jgi:hypothetical protein